MREGRIISKKRVKKEDSKFSFWSLAPFIIVAVGILIVTLLNDGYTYFENNGWNTIYIVGLRKIYYIATAVIYGVISYILIKFYLSIVSDWKEGCTFSAFNKFFEMIIITIFILGPALVGIYLIINTFLILISPNDSYWEGVWHLRFKR